MEVKTDWTPWCLSFICWLAVDASATGVEMSDDIGDQREFWRSLSLVTQEVLDQLAPHFAMSPIKTILESKMVSSRLAEWTACEDYNSSCGHGWNILKEDGGMAVMTMRQWKARGRTQLLVISAHTYSVPGIWTGMIVHRKSSSPMETIA